jgi:hypothetical protein
MNLLSRVLRALHPVRTTRRPTPPARWYNRPFLEILENRWLPSTLSGFVYNDANNNGTKDAGEAGIAGATVTLTGITTQNHSVNLTAKTDASGAYSFTNLAAGTYTLSTSAPSGYVSGTASAGTQGGTGGGTVSGITIDANTTGTDNDFGELSTANGWTAVTSNFNGTAIPAGSTLWFNAAFKVNGVGSTPVTLSFTNQTISFTANGTTSTYSVPNSVITISPTATSATTTFDAASITWETTLPPKFSGNAFLGGLALPLPNGLPGGVQPVTWQGQLTSDTAGVSVNWQWGTAVYTNFSSDYNALDVKPVDDNQASQYKNSDHAGTPEAFKPFVIGGARGGGGSNFTGSYSGTAQVKPPVQIAPASLSGLVTDTTGAGVGGAVLTLTLTSTGQSVIVTTAANGSFSFTGLQPGTYTLTEGPPGSYLQQSASAGTVNGTSSGTGVSGPITGIVLASGDTGTNYDFVDIFAGS